MAYTEDLHKLHEEQRTKLIYYTMGIAVAAVGFAVIQTVDAVLSWQLIPWGIAVLCWMASIVNGLWALDGALWMLRMQAGNSQASGGVNPINGETMQAWEKEIAVKSTMKALRIGAEEVPIPFHWQRRLLYVGVLAFIIWHAWRIAN